MLHVLGSAVGKCPAETAGSWIMTPETILPRFRQPRAPANAFSHPPYRALGNPAVAASSKRLLGLVFHWNQRFMRLWSAVQNVTPKAPYEPIAASASCTSFVRVWNGQAPVSGSLSSGSAYCFHSRLPTFP